MSAPSFSEQLRVFARIGLLSFGGPAAQIAVMHRELVELRGWLTERQFLSALSFCMLLPGPEAMQLATYAGWRLSGVRGGLAAGLLFVIPGALVVGALAWGYAVWGRAPLVEAAFLGVKAAVLAIVAQALLKVAKKALTRHALWGVAGAAFAAIFLFGLPFPFIVLAAACWGAFAARGRAAQAAEAPSVPLSATLRTAAVWGAVWAAPPALAALIAPGLLTDLAAFFSTLAVVTFGGAYAVLAYMAQDVVGVHGWLAAGEMIDGLGLAETTPGPLILVTEFVGFLAGWREGGLGLAFLGAGMTLWVTFAPCFLWIFAGAPYVERLSAAPRLSGALEAITAAVVGVILNLSIWFALHVLFAEVGRHDVGPSTIWTPEWATLDPLAAALALGAGAAIFGFSWGVGRVLALAALAGLAAGLA